MAQKKTFSISAAISFGFKEAKKHFAFFAVCILVLIATSAIPNLASSFFKASHQDMLGLASDLIGWAVKLTIDLGIIYVALKIHDRKKSHYSDLFKQFH